MGDEELMNEEPQSEVLPTITEPDIVPSGKVGLEAQIRARIKELQDAVDRRSEMPFNPTLMAMASGFLKPSLTGGFGESLGYALEGGAKAMETERSRRSELEKLKLDLALKQYDLARKEQARGMLNRFMTGAGGPQTTLSQTEGGEEAPQKTVDVTPEQAVKVVSKMPDAIYKMTMNDEIVTALTNLDPETGKLAKQIWDMQKGMVEIGQKEREIRVREKEASQKEFDTVEKPHPFDPGDTIRLSRKDIPDYEKVLATGNPIKVSKFLAEKGTPGYFGKTFEDESGEGFKPPPTKGQREAETGAQIKLREKQMQERADFETVLNDSVGNANENIQRSKMAKGLATDPKTKNAFGIIASKPGMQGAVLQFLKDPIHFGEVHVGISNIEDLIRQGGGTQQEIEAAQALDNILMPIQLSYRRNLMKGTGPVSDMETAMTNKMSAQLSDTARIIQFKSDMIIARSEYDKLLGDVYQRWSDNNTSGTMSQFRQSKDFKDASDAYMNQLRTINNAYFPKSQLKPSQKSSETTSSSSIWQKIQSRGKE